MRFESFWVKKCSGTCNIFYTTVVRMFNMPFHARIWITITTETAFPFHCVFNFYHYVPFVFFDTCRHHQPACLFLSSRWPFMGLIRSMVSKIDTSSMGCQFFSSSSSDLKMEWIEFQRSGKLFVVESMFRSTEALLSIEQEPIDLWCLRISACCSLQCFVQL